MEKSPGSQSPARVFTDKKERENKIRKRSSEELEERKREKLEPQKSEGSKIEPLKFVRGKGGKYQIVPQSHSKTDDMSAEDMKTQMIAAMMSREVTDHWLKTLNITVDKKIDDKLDPIKAEIKLMKKKYTEHDSTLEDIKIKLDDQEMQDRDRNIVVEGLKEESREGVTQELNDLLGTELTADEIDTTYRLKPKIEIRNAKPKTRIIFKHKFTKSEVVKEKTKLKGKDIWVNDDLTQLRSRLAYEARQAVKGGLVEKTWVHDGKIFLKKFDEDRPLKVACSKDIPK